MKHGQQHILAFDTSGTYCAAAILTEGKIVRSVAEQMDRGQAERLMPLLQDLLADAGLTWQDLCALGVGIGPGNFTGIRIAVSAARGLALGLDIPAVGVSGCDARSYLAAPGSCPAIPASRDMVYLCNSKNPEEAPQLLPLPEAVEKATQSGLQVNSADNPQDIVEAIAHITADRWQGTNLPPAPLYARPADAAPSRDAPPVLLD